MPNIYIKAAQALQICVEAEAELATKPALNVGNRIEMQACSPEQVRAAILHVREQVKLAEIFSKEENIVVCIFSHHQDAFAWALGK